MSNITRVTMETINSKELPCSFDKGEFTPQIPRDNQCEFEYIRVLSEESRNKDKGGCSSTPGLMTRYRYVYFSSTPKNNQKIFMDFWNKIKDENRSEIVGYSFDVGVVSKAEKTDIKNLKLKQFTYIYVDYTQYVIMSNCELPC